MDDSVMGSKRLTSTTVGKMVSWSEESCSDIQENGVYGEW